MSGILLTSHTARHAVGVWFYPLVFSALLSVLLLPMVQVFPNGILEDDGYFYAQIAYNIANLGLSSFDGINLTSGYHLLWAGLLSLVSMIVSVFTEDKLSSLFFLVFFNIALFASISRLAFKRNIERLCAFVFFLMSSLLMETILLAGLLLFITSRFLDRDRVFGDSRLDLLAIFLIPLTRIDSSIILGVLSLYFLLFDRRIFARIVPALVLGVAAHFFVMQIAFGELVSVSSLLKVSDAAILHGDFSHVVQNMIASKAQLVRFLAVVFLAVLAATNILLTDDRGTRLRKAAILLAILAFFLPPFLVITMRSWYFLPVHLVLLHLATRPDIGDAHVRRQSLATGAFSIGLCIAYLVGNFLYQQQYRNDQINSAFFAKNLKTLVAEAEPVFQIDGSGFTGFFSERQLINGDGLVNSHAYARRLRANRLAGYLDEQGVCMIVANSADQNRDLIIDFHGLLVRRDEAELLYVVPDDGINKYTNFQLYRLKEPRCRRTR